MEQIEDRITFAACLITGWSIDRHAALHAQRRAVIPDARHGSMGHIVHLVQVGTPSVDDEYIGHAGHIANHVDIAGIHHLQAVHQKGVAVEFGSQRFGCRIFPHAVLPFLQIGHAWPVKLAERSLDLLRGQEVARHLHLHGLGSPQAECHRMVSMDFGRNNRSVSPQGLLREGNHAHQHQSCKEKKSFHHGSIVFTNSHRFTTPKLHRLIVRCKQKTAQSKNMFISC